MSNSQNSWKSFTTVIGDKHNIQGSCFTSEGWMGYNKCKQSCGRIFFWPLFQVFLPPAAPQALPGCCSPSPWVAVAGSGSGAVRGRSWRGLSSSSPQCRIPKCFGGIIYPQGLRQPRGSAALGRELPRVRAASEHCKWGALASL